MPIYKITNKQSGIVTAVKANNKSQALNFVVGEEFEAEPMTAEDVVGHMEAGNSVKDAAQKSEHKEAPVTRSADVQEMDESYREKQLASDPGEPEGEPESLADIDQTVGA